jgi:hypothetical protein
MNEQWIWRGADPDKPETDGWYAVVKCWDSEEGMFPDVCKFSGGKWAGNFESAISAFCGPFPTEAEAQDWANRHDPEA